MTVLYLSPHLDDAALSAGLAILSLVRAGERVVVATVFSEGREASTRKAEDVAAISLLGAEPLHLGMLDFPERRGRPPSFRALCIERDERAEEVEVRAVTERVTELARALSPRCVHFPLGVGGHVDHRVVHEARQAVPREQRRFYEDLPYALSRAWSTLRREGALTPAQRVALRRDLESTLAGFGATPDDIARLGRGGGETSAPVQGLRELEADAVRASQKRAALSLYRSQTGVFDARMVAQASEREWSEGAARVT